MLARELTVVLFSVGFDPYLGFFHQPRYGRPALALDLMEEYRPLIADSLVLTVVNNGELRSEHFVRGLGAVSLTAAGRRKFIEAYERRMSQEITHPIFGYRISVSYDISDPKRRRQIYRTMRGFGQHLQLSVFSCDLTPSQRTEMIAALENAIDRDEDQILLIDLGPSQAQPIHQIEALGRPLAVKDRGPVVL